MFVHTKQPINIDHTTICRYRRINSNFCGFSCQIQWIPTNIKTNQQKKNNPNIVRRIRMLSSFEAYFIVHCPVWFLNEIIFWPHSNSCFRSIEFWMVFFSVMRTRESNHLFICLFVSLSVLRFWFWFFDWSNTAPR